MDSSLTTASSETLLADLHAALPAGSLLTSEADIAFGANDVYRTGGLPLAVARPQSVAGVQALVRLCSAAGVAIVPRGGGASYTDGYLHKPGGHVLIDTSGLDSINIDEANAVVTVGAGVTWARLKAELDQRGLRTPFWGPFGDRRHHWWQRQPEHAESWQQRAWHFGPVDPGHGGGAGLRRHTEHQRGGGHALLWA